jgi:glycosyltransferase involved in cell wall biosynthesis
MNPKKGGVAEAAAQSALLLKEENIDIEILCFDNPTDDWIIKAEYKVITMAQYLTCFAINFKYIPWLIKNIKNYDLVIIDGLWLFHLLGGYISKIFNIPYVVYTHGMLDPYFNENKLKYLKKMPFWFLIDRNILNMAKYVIYTCEEEKLISKSSFPLYNPNEYVVTLGIEKDTVEESILKKLFIETFSDLESKSVILYLSRIHPKKGLELLIEAVNQKKDLLDNHIFVIAGSGDEKYISELKSLINNYDLNDFFKWVGNLSGDLKWSAFYSADSFILPSHSENFGIVVAEALSIGTPVLITNKINIYKEIERYNAGFVENDDIEGISNLISKFINNKNKNILNTNAFECYQNCFSKNAFKKDFINLLNNIKGKNEN